MDINTLTKSQKEVFQKFCDFMLASDKHNLIIQGSAGTGKSYLTKYLIEDGIANYKQTCKTLNLPIKYWDYEVCATTNKAVDSLSNLLTLPANKSITTLTSLLKLHLAYDRNKKKQVLVPNDNQMIIHNKIIFIDECSMISKDLFEFINMVLKDCKVIFIGDKYQLPPVREKHSAVYDFAYPEACLTEPVRNAGKPELVALCQQLKDTCETGIWKDIHSVPGSIEVVKDGNLFNQIIDSNFLISDPEKRILAYSNQRVTDYAQYIMQLRGEQEYLAAGSWYVSNEYYAPNANFHLSIDSLVQVLDVDRNPPEKDYDLFGINSEENIKNKLLCRVKVHSPKFNFNWIDYAFSNPDFYFEYMKHLRKTNMEKYIKAKSRLMDLRRNESCTVHKAQGSTLDTVFIDLYDIGSCTQKDLTAKLLYVAASRAKNKIVFYGELPKRYGVSVV